MIFITLNAIFYYKDYLVDVGKGLWKEWFKHSRKSWSLASFLFSIDLISLTSSMAINQADSGFTIPKYISANWLVV